MNERPEDDDGLSDPEDWLPEDEPKPPGSYEVIHDDVPDGLFDDGLGD